MNGSFSDVSSQCASRGLSGANLIDCTNWLSKVPTTISSMNRGLGTLQYQSLSVNAQDPLNDIMGGTQDNGTHAFTSKSNGNGKGNSNWFVTIFGDGGQSGIDVGNPNIRMHTFFGRANRHELPRHRPAWVELDGRTRLLAKQLRARSFYIPLIFGPAR